MIRWLDVTENDWFYNEVMEASNLFLEDGKPLVEGMAYGAFEAGAPFIYEEQDGSAGKKIFTLGSKITTTADNPLFVFIDGTQSLFKAISDNAGGTTNVEFYVAPPAGSVVSFASSGMAKVDRFGRPAYPTDATGFAYPSHALDDGQFYYYNPYSRQYQEYLYAYGRPLKRITVPDQEWSTSTGQDLAAKYIGYQTDVYIISPAPTATLYVPYNLNGVQCRFIYNNFKDGWFQMKGGYFRATAAKVWRNDRFFPNALISRAEAFALIDRIRNTFYSRFTDADAQGPGLDETITAFTGQKVFRLNGAYPAGQHLAVFSVDGRNLQTSEYMEIDRHTVMTITPLEEGQEFHGYYHKDKSDRFADIGVTGQQIYDSTNSVFVDVPQWVAPSIMSMEGETFNNGEYLIQGIGINRWNGTAPIVDSMYTPNDSENGVTKVDYFMPLTLLKRNQATAFLNRFRKWCIERFK